MASPEPSKKVPRPSPKPEAKKQSPKPTEEVKPQKVELPPEDPPQTMQESIPLEQDKNEPLQQEHQPDSKEVYLESKDLTYPSEKRIHKNTLYY